MPKILDKNQKFENLEKEKNLEFFQIFLLLKIMKCVKIYGKSIKTKPQSKLNEDIMAKSKSPLKNLHQSKTPPLRGW